MNALRKLGVTAVVGAALVVPVVTAVSASAAPTGRPGVSATGSCTGGGTWELKAKTDDGQLEVEFEVDTNVAGQRFTVKVFDGPTTVFNGKAATAGRSGSFSVERLTADRAGVDTITARASRPGNVCAGTIRI